MAISAVDNWINGASQDSSSDVRMDLVDPSTGEVFATAAESNAEDVDSAVAAAASAFPGWSSTTPATRQKALLEIADILEQHAAELVELESENTGKPVALTMAEEIPPMIDQLRFFAGAARVLEGKAAAEYMEGLTSWIRREPVGVVAQVTPWNYPMMMAIWKFAPAIAAGNTVVLKPSDTTPVSTVRMAQLIGDVLPPGVFNVITGCRETGRLLVSHPRPDMVAITGSVRAGVQVATEAAAAVKRVHLELGGKAPAVVFDDADVAAAAEALAVAGYFNAGQDCTASTRVLAGPKVYDDLVSALGDQARDAVTTFAAGRLDDDAFVPAMNNEAQMAKVLGFLERAPSHAEIVAGGSRQGGAGFHIEPTVIANLQQGDEMVQEEIFGPVITVQPFASEEEAIAMANGVRYGLASSVWTRDIGRGLRMSKAMDFGCAWIHTHIPLVAEMPHGGFKQSGYGKDLSMYGFDDYTRVKHVMASLD